MGIFTDALAIILGGLFGGKLQKRSNSNNYHILGIGIMIVSLVGFLENVYNVQGASIVSENLTVVLFAYLIGNKTGEVLQLETRLSNLSNTKDKSFNAFIDAALYFGIGGLQISGPILLAINHDNSQLYLKTFLDIPFAIVFGATYGKVVSLSAVPVAIIQIIIAAIACFFSGFFSGVLIAQLCAMGYIILFFSGFNLMTDGKYRINNINMLPGVFLIILYNVFTTIIKGI